MSTNLLTLQYSHNIIEHLGLKLYQNKPTNVIAELISNSWDAEAKNVNIKLNSNTNGEQVIYISDDGIGMSLEDLKSNYLVIGKTKDVDRTGENQSRKPMGRKGIGKLAPFGIANIVTVLTVKSNKVNMFELNYDSMLESAKNKNGISIYSPNHIINDCDLEIVSENLETVFGTCDENIIQPCKDFIDSINSSDSKSGTIILLSDLKTKKTISPETLKKSIGNRFTVTLNTPDFKIKINDKIIEESDIFPQWALRVPSEGFNTEQLTLDKFGKVVEIKYWVGFVEEAKWSSDEAGIGVYAHGKIAQDRPFFFNIKGKEIFTRYMYGVVEADWIDELANDEISTDRTSINWDNEIFDDFFDWGVKKVNEWTNNFRQFKSEVHKKVNLDLLSNYINERELNVKDSEKAHLNDIISEITPNMDPDPEQKSKLIDATLKAWLHEPARNLIKKLWNETSQVNGDEFTKIIVRLNDELIPESLSLAVMFSQRVFALTKLHNNILLKNETYLQVLLENFPWILGNSYEKLSFRQSLKTIVREAEMQGLIQPPQILNMENAENKQPDFVFFSDPEDNNILVIELKGPDIPARMPEFQQLRNYMDYLQERYTNSTVKGILIAGSFAEPIKKQKPDTIEFSTWDTILLQSRKEHMIYLSALLDTTEPSANDARVQQIIELGGKPVQDFIEQMAKNNESLSMLMKQIENQEQKRDRKAKPN